MSEQIITYNGETHSESEWRELLGIGPRRENSHKRIVRQFAEQVNFNGAVPNKMLYAMFVEWSGTSAIPQGSFAKLISMFFREYRPDVKPYRNMHERGWRA